MVTQKKRQVLLLYHSGVQVRLTSYSYHVFVATVSCFIYVCVVCLVKVSLLKRGSIVELRNAKGRSSCTTVSGLNRNDFHLFTDTDCAFFFFDTLSESDDTVDDDGHSFNGGANAADVNDDSRSSGNSEKSKKKREFVKRVCLLPKHMLKIFRSTLLLPEGVCQTSSFLKLVHLFPKNMLKILRTNVFY